MKTTRGILVRPIVFAVLATICGWLATVSTNAQEKKEASDEKPKPSAEELAWMEELTALPPGEHSGLNSAAIHFNLSWNNVLNAGELAFVLDYDSPENGDDDRVLIGAAKGRSSGLARLLWPYDVEARSMIDPDSIRPHLFELSETERGKSVSYELDFQPGKVVSETTVLAKKEGEESETKRKIYRFEPLHDILSAALYLRSLELSRDGTVTALVSPFNRPYHAEFKFAGKEKRKIRRENYDTLKFHVSIRKVNHDKTLQTYDKMKKATIWVSDDEYRLPIEVHADIFIGFVSARMTERTWIAGSDSTNASMEGKKKKSNLDRFLEESGKSRASGATE